MSYAMVTELIALTMLTMALVGLAYSACVLALLTFWEIRQKVRCWRVRRELSQADGLPITLPIRGRGGRRAGGPSVGERVITK